jgi:hypothetical protein
VQQPEAAGAKVQQRFDNLNYNDIKKGKQLKFLRVSCGKLERFRSFVRSRGDENVPFFKKCKFAVDKRRKLRYNNRRRRERLARHNGYAAVAHLVERHLAKVEVASSSLVGRSIIVEV